MLEEKIQKDLVEAMKSHLDVKVAALRSIKAAMLVEKTNGSHHELTDDEIVKVIQKLSKQRQESFDIYNEAGRGELAMKELQEKNYLDEYLPKMIEENVLEGIIDHIIIELEASSMKDMGKVMKTLSERYPNQYDGKFASTYIKNKLM